MYLIGVFFDRESLMRVMFHTTPLYYKIFNFLLIFFITRDIAEGHPVKKRKVVCECAWFEYLSVTDRAKDFTIAAVNRIYP